MLIYIGEVEEICNYPMYDVLNAVEELKQVRRHPTHEKMEEIKDLLK
jgi:23S rRNA (uracil1939-C5)-methyltransferase